MEICCLHFYISFTLTYIFYSLFTANKPIFTLHSNATAEQKKYSAIHIRCINKWIFIFSTTELYALYRYIYAIYWIECCKVWCAYWLEGKQFLHFFIYWNWWTTNTNNRNKLNHWCVDSIQWSHSVRPDNFRWSSKFGLLPNIIVCLVDTSLQIVWIKPIWPIKIAMHTIWHGMSIFQSHSKRCGTFSNQLAVCIHLDVVRTERWMMIHMQMHIYVTSNYAPIL